MNENDRVLQEQICWGNVQIKSHLSQLSPQKPASQSTDQPVFFVQRDFWSSIGPPLLFWPFIGPTVIYLHSLHFFCFVFFVPVTLRDGVVCTLPHAFMSRPEGRRNTISVKSNYSGSCWPVWSCASFNMAAHFLPKPPRLQDVHSRASELPFAFNFSVVWHAVRHCSELRRTVSAQCSFPLRERALDRPPSPPPPFSPPSPLTSPVTEQLTPPSVWDCCFITQIKICTFVRASPRSHVLTWLSRVAWLHAVFTVVAWAPARRVFI